MKTKEELYADILQAAKAGECYISGDLVFALAFRTLSELQKIAQELNIPITK
jgi:hypothetical protein